MAGKKNRSYCEYQAHKQDMMCRCSLFPGPWVLRSYLAQVQAIKQQTDQAKNKLS